MSAQIEDVFRVNDQDYKLIAMSALIPFVPQDYGLNPQYRSTACWRGYWCEYNINLSSLFLQNLYMYNSENHYPDINGVSVSPQTYHEVIGYSYKNGPRKLLREDHSGHRKYENVNLRIPFTGRILVGDRFIQEYYIHMGFQRSWAYEVLKEFVFEQGNLKETNDYSEIAKIIRQRMDDSNIDPRRPEGSDMLRHIKNSFAQDYSINAWWVKTGDEKE